MKPALGVALILCALAGFTGAARAGQKEKTLDVYWIDSEGGGSTLIVTPNDESVLIDTGKPGGRDSARIVAMAKGAGLNRIDYLIITHYHIDHFGGAAEIAQQLPIGTIYQRAIPPRDPDGRPVSSFPMLIKPFRDIPVKREALAPGVIIPLRNSTDGPKLELRCVAADQKFIPPTAAQAGEKNPLAGRGKPKELIATDNDNSAVFVLEFGGFRFFNGGDLTWNLEEKLVVPINLVGPVDVYQTNHHGLDVSNNPVLIHGLAPTVAVMNNGPKKGGMPAVFATLRNVPSLQARYQLHQSMNAPAKENAPAEYIANQGTLRGENARKCPANFIKMSVAPDARTYTISIPAKGHARTFQTTAK